MSGAPAAGSGGAGAIVSGATLRDGLVLRPDVCVIGSGPGGAMAASRCARAGLSVVVLEEGGHHRKDGFDMLEATAYPKLYQDRGMRASADLSVSVLQGRAVGGGTVVNWTTSFRTPDHVVEWWREREGAEVTPAQLSPHFEEIEARLGIAKVDLEDANPNNRALWDGCTKLGWQVDTLRRNVRGCLRLGYCGMGCPVDAKQSAALTYLPDAVAAGARVLCDTRALRLEWSGKRVAAVAAQALDPATHRPLGRSLRVEPRAVVVSGGALNSPALLLRSGLTQGPVGRMTWLHPAAPVVALYRERIEAFSGAPQTVASHQFARRAEGMGFFLEAAPVHPMTAGIAAPGFGAALRGRTKALARLALGAAILIDGFAGDPEAEPGGVVSLRPDGGPRLDYPFSARFYEGYRAGLTALARAHLANGALEVSSLHTRAVTCRSEAELPRLAEAPLGPNQMAAYTFHQMGGCRMGSDPRRSVVDPRLRHHWLENLWVMDGSVFPTSLGVNPMESIYGISSWASRHLLDSLG